MEADIVAGLMEDPNLERGRPVLAWVVLLCCFGLGLVGAVVPGVPGALLVVLGVVGHALLDPAGATGTVGFAVLVGLLVVSYLINWLASALGARWAGSTGWGLLGLVVGGLVGMFFPFPGLILGPLLGAFVFEMVFAEKRAREAGRASWGGFLGSVTAMLVEVGVVTTMVAWFFVERFYLQL